MLKIGRRHWFLLTLPGVVLFAALLIGSTEVLSGEQSTALAAVQHNEQAVDNGPGCTGTHSTPSFESVVVVNSGEVICSNVTSFGGTVVIQGVVNGNVVTFNGDVVISGRVYGNITLYGGNVTWQDGAHVDGDIHVCGGRWIGTTSRLHGTVFDCTRDVGQLVLGDGGASFRFWSILTWIILGLFVTSLLPEHVMIVRTTVKSKMRRCLVLGLLTVLLAPAVLAVLIALIISLPLAILVVIGLIAAWALGTVAIGWILGEYILRILALHHKRRSMQVVVGLAALALAGSLPYIGWFVSIGAGLIGLGAVFLSRFGTRLYSQPRQPLSL
ncbi:MAG: polymer-forming cytoskeletal protein [Ktedonobacteraceae bacterium]|nr:polymer-forming cytoskeletal protein [Ktedonobacteraceae bacterium]MBV9616987.1 polymer-forming cytoskeletal protein [Ktedonobacteraceae bacterium]MBV9711734.1 polymer-forming cytoskeletal protein [Ktedonobacteraceae bacterium]